MSVKFDKDQQILVKCMQFIWLFVMFFTRIQNSNEANLIQLMTLATMTDFTMVVLRRGKNKNFGKNNYRQYSLCLYMESWYMVNELGTPETI